MAVNRPPPTDIGFRIGSAAVGMLAGLIISLIVIIPSFFLLSSEASFSRFVLGSCILGALLGLAYPNVAWNLFEGTLHFLFGAFLVATEGDAEPSASSPTWLKMALWLGIGAALLFMGASIFI